MAGRRAEKFIQIELSNFSTVARAGVRLPGDYANVI